MANSRIVLIVIGIFLTAQAAWPQRCLSDEVKCTGKYKGVLTPTDDELKEILKQHDAWLKDHGTKLANDPRRANLCDANLNGVQLEGAHLDGANLNGVQLEGAHLDGANLNDAQLTFANLNKAHLNGVQLEGAHLDGANLNDAQLTFANLNKAHLEGAQLEGANLDFAQVSKAKLSYANLTDAVYAPASEPPDPYVAGIKGLATIKTDARDEVGLVQLRKLLKDAGLNDMERQATFSIQHNITRDQLSTWNKGIGPTFE